MKTYLSAVFLVVVFMSRLAHGQAWQQIEPGLEVGTFAAPISSRFGESTIHVVRIDSARFGFRLLCASQHGKRKRSAPEWCREFHLVGAVNASMFAEDGLTSTGLLIADGHVNNGKVNPSFGAVFMFHPVRPDLPVVRLVDRHCDDFVVLRPLYTSMVQNFRIITCDRKPAWKQSDRIFSQVAVGMDSAGRVLVLFTRSPYSGHDFARNLLRLPLGLTRAMYCEGGPEASVYIKSSDYELRLTGSYETGFIENDSNKDFWPIPNVLGFAHKPGRPTEVGSEQP